jgi:UDP-N-acetylmuramoyl-L-alanyl-D-glutamate--2,6-diaminopimelate ligase
LVFTGLYPEHIESHGSFENYRAAKEALFAHLKTCKTKYINEAGKVVRPESELKKTELNRVKKSTVINADDENAPYFMKYCCEQRLLISQKEKLDVKIKENDRLFKYGDIMSSQAGISFIADGKEVSLKLLGEFNATNAVMALGVGLLRDLEFTKLVKGISNISGVPGRLEQIDEGQAFSVIVDYAFEPKAVSKLYETVNLIPHEKIIHVLGSTGGGRDVARRPKLGELAGEMADYVIVTNEDPYDDDPNLIIDQVALGAENKGKKINKNLFKILDRKEAIRKACLLAEEGDIVLITGKGSEQAICVANGKMIPWDDREEVRKILQKI